MPARDIDLFLALTRVRRAAAETRPLLQRTAAFEYTRSMRLVWASASQSSSPTSSLTNLVSFLAQAGPPLPIIALLQVSIVRWLFYDQLLIPAILFLGGRKQSSGQWKLEHTYLSASIARVLKGKLDRFFKNSDEWPALLSPFGWFLKATKKNPCTYRWSEAITQRSRLEAYNDAFNGMLTKRTAVKGRWGERRHNWNL